MRRGEASRAWGRRDHERSIRDGIGDSMTWDRWWAAAKTVAAVVGPFLAILLFILNRETKGLAFDTVSTAVLVDLTDPRLSSLKLTYKDISVSRLTVVTFEVRNSGTRPIEQADFKLPLVIRFKNPNDVLAVTLNEKKTPPDLKPSISSDDRGITIDPLLLNSGDTFRITVQLRGDFNEPTVEARISGVPSISRQTLHELDPTRRGLIQITFGVVLTFIYFYFWMLFARTSRRLQPVKQMSIPESLVVGVALGIGGAAFFESGATTLRLSDIEMSSWFAVVLLLSPIVILPFYWRARRQANAETLVRGDGTQPP